MDFSFIIPISISVIAVIVAVFLYVKNIIQERRFRFIRLEDTKKIEGLAREREELKKELIEKLDLLSKSSEQERKILLEILERRDEARDKEKEDMINLLEYRMRKMGEEMEDRIKDRLNRIFIQIEDINKRLLKLENPSD